MERRKFTPEFKHQVVEQAMAAGNNSVVARKYEIRPDVVSKWVRQYKAGQAMQGSSPKGNATLVTQQEHASWSPRIVNWTSRMAISNSCWAKRTLKSLSCVIY